MAGEALLIAREMLANGSVKLTFSLGPGKRRDVILAPGQEDPAHVAFVAKALHDRYNV